MRTKTKKQTMVERMREIREEVSHEIMTMTIAEERAYLAEGLKNLKAKRNKAKR